jgi:3-oxoadipate enol-lactonase
MNARLRHVRGPDADIAWREDGRPGQGPVVLVHSLGLDGEMWTPQVDGLARTHHVIRVDVRGHGGSSAPEGPYAMADLAADVLRVADTLGLHRFDIAGLSIGGQIALWLASHRPDRIGGLVLADTAARIGSPGVWQERMDLVRGGGLAAIRDGVLRRWFLPDFALAAPDVHAWAAERLVTTPAAGYLGCCGALAASDLRADVGRVRARTLVIVGEGDLATPPDDARWLRDHVDGARLEVIEGAAHISNLEAPAVFGSLLQGFLSDPAARDQG